MMKNIGVIIELENGKIKETNFGMITLARANDAELYAIVIDADVLELKKELESYGINKIVDISLIKEQQNNPAVIAGIIINVMQEYNISVIFGLSSVKGKDLLPRIAAMADKPLIMDCFDVNLDQNQVKTSQYSGKTIATISITGDIMILGVRPNAVESVKKAVVSADIIKFEDISVDSKGFKVIKIGETNKNTSVSLADAEVIVAGGRGMKNSENFGFLFQCAKKLNAATGASRVAVDSGWVPYSMQVGQTGEKVSPKVYIACGISGSIQHYAGMKTSGMVIAINNDENASIMSNCDYYVNNDALKIIPELAKYLK